MKNVCTAYLNFSQSLNELLKRSLQTFELQTLLFFHFRFVRRVLRTPSRRVCRVAQVFKRTQKHVYFIISSVTWMSKNRFLWLFWQKTKFFVNMCFYIIRSKTISRIVFKHHGYVHWLRMTIYKTFFVMFWKENMTLQCNSIFFDIAQ